MSDLVPTDRGENRGSEKQTKSPSLLGRFITPLERIREEREKKRINEEARKRLSILAESLRNLVDSPEFRSREEKTTHDVYVSSFPAAEEGFYYNVWIGRNDKGRAYKVWTTISPDTEHTTGIGDGSWIITFRDNHFRKDKKDPALKVSEGQIKGDFYLGDLKEVVDEIDITSDRTRIHLKEIGFGGHPVAHVNILFWGQDSKIGESLGPIGRIRELWVHGIARKVNPVDDDNVMDDDFRQVSIGEDFGKQGIDFHFGQGDLGIEIEKQDNNLVIASKGIRRRLPLIGQPPPEPEEEALVFKIPLENIGGMMILSKLEKVVEDLRLGFEKSRLLELTEDV